MDHHICLKKLKLKFYAAKNHVLAVGNEVILYSIRIGSVWHLQTKEERLWESSVACKPFVRCKRTLAGQIERWLVTTNKLTTISTNSTANFCCVAIVNEWNEAYFERCALLDFYGVKLKADTTFYTTIFIEMRVISNASSVCLIVRVAKVFIQKSKKTEERNYLVNGELFTGWLQL